MTKITKAILILIISALSVQGEMIKEISRNRNESSIKLCESVSKKSELSNSLSPTTYMRSMDGRELSEIKDYDISSNIFDAGMAPEGDAGQFARFTPDGSKVVFCNRMSNTITVHSVPDGEMIASYQFENGDYPAQIDINENYAVVSLLFGQKIVVLNSTDWSMVQTFDSATNPFAVKIRNNKAFIACEGEDVLEIIDLTTLTKTSIDGVPWGTASASGTYSFNRTCYTGHVLEVTDDGKYVASFESGSSSLPGFITLVDTETETVYKFENDEKFKKCSGLGISGDNKKLIAATGPNSGVYFLQFDIETKQLEKTIFKSGEYIFSGPECVVNMNGNKAICPGGGNDWYVNFETETATPVNNYDSAAEHRYASNDHTKAFIQNFRTYVIDLETGSTINDFFQTGTGAGKIAISPLEDFAVTFDGVSDEFARVLKYDNYHASFHGTFTIGDDPEGDGPRDIAITPDGNYAVVSNGISCSATIVDLNTKSVEAVLQCGPSEGWSAYAQDLAITSDSRYALVTTYSNKTIAIIDILAKTIVKTVDTGLDYPCQLAISPDDNFAFIGSAGDEKIAKIKLDGENSQLLSVFAGPIIGGSYGGDFAPMKVTPDGETLIVSDAYSQALNLYSTEDGTLIKSLSFGGSALYVAFNDDCSKALLVHGNKVTLVELDGSFSQVINSITVAGDYAGVGSPVYNSVNNTYLILTSDYQDCTYKTIDGETGEVINTYQLPVNESSYKASVTKDGDLLFHYILENEYQEFKIKIIDLETGDETIADTAIPFWGAAMNIDQNIYAGVVPGPDLINIVKLNGTDIVENVTIPNNLNLISSYPNPFNPETTINYTVPSNGLVNLAVYNSQGELVETIVNRELSSGNYTAAFNGANLSSGVYYYRISINNISQTKCFTLLK
ncbi:MAG: beta-propeller fold lactonase family protein [Candidatus Delongbacteria bacterium]|nr:beta-propeller fold lactonase family protein [Candidatus Delongbacteria bacterium]MBN2836478.1 beta-propeller fold lactonase family protein [Candidatus Delongbacteria bacterium]